jgi:hypothetical protein
VRKNFNPVEDSHAGRDLPSTAPTYIRNIQTGKSKKESKSSEKPQVVREVSLRTEKGEKILVLGHFSESHPEERTHRGEERTGD